MRSSSELHNHDQVKTLETTMPLRAVSELEDGANGSTGHGANGSTEELLRKLVERLGGPHAVIEQLTAMLETGITRADVTENTEGFCYLRLFDSVEHRDATTLGYCPTVAAVRRFSNGRSDPFGSRTVTVKVEARGSDRIAHVVFDTGVRGLRPVSALAALSKDLRVGLPDGVSEDFPPGWVPHDSQVAQTWDYTTDGQARSLDVLQWLGDRPSWLDKSFEPISHPTSRIRWVLRVNPLGPTTGTIDVIDPRGKVISVRSWDSYVAHTGYHQGWSVRGSKVFAEAYVWRAARVLTDPSAPLPTLPPNDGHGELFNCNRGFAAVEERPTIWGQREVGVHTIPSADLDKPGYCYGHAFEDPRAAVLALGAFPRVKDVSDYLGRRGKFADISPTSANHARRSWLQLGKPGSEGAVVVHHVTPSSFPGSVDFWEVVDSLGEYDRLGATQSATVGPGDLENVSTAPVLTLRPRAQGLMINVPFVAIMELQKETLLWDISESRKLGIVMSYFESVELVSLKLKATVHKGDNDTLLTVVADSFSTPLTLEHDWLGAAHTLLVAGNVNGATTGELVLEGNTGFGAQLKGVSVGAPTPVIQAKLETTVSAKAYIKIMLALRVSGTGLPKALPLPTKAAKAITNGGPTGAAVTESDEESD